MRHPRAGLWLSVLVAGLTAPLLADDGLSCVLDTEISASQDFDRRAALQSARTEDEANDAWWQSGFVRIKGDWHPVESASPLDVRLWAEYRSRRAAAKDTSAAQIKLANWCRRNDLPAQERVHLTRALRLGEVANPAAVYQRLGYRQVGRWWFTDDELQAYQQHERAVARRAAKLAPRLEKLAIRLERDPQDREKVVDELAKLITDEESLVVLERGFSGRSEAAGLATVEILSRIDSFRVSQALARLAIVSDYEGVRAATIETLRQRRWEDFIPMTLEMLYLPVEIQSSFVSQDSKHGWRFLLQREGRQRIEAAAFTVVVDVTSSAMLPGQGLIVYDSLRSNEDLNRRALDELQTRMTQADLANDRMEVLNERASAMMAAVTTQQDTNDLQSWWTWWDNVADSQLAEDKSTLIVSEEVSEFVFDEGIPEFLPLGITEIPISSTSCLAAGTPVRTSEGFVAIEKIQRGDLVLAKDIETGEIAFKPVLETTRRLGAPLTNVIVGGETFAASPGHNFWISGRGWMRTNQMTESTEPRLAHTATGAVRIAVEPADRVGDVFNLVVADFHTYFVGTSMVLGHDVLPPEPTDHRLPGLKPEFAIAK